MNTLNKKPLFLAIAGITALGVVGAAQAVSVSPTGQGQVLIYPYYTVNGAAGFEYNTLLSVVNSTTSTKAVKIRFREGKASVEVLDFNIFLSPSDVWTGYLEPSATGGVKLGTADKSCTIPAIPATGVEFRNGAYKGDAVKDDSLGRLREGYVEIFEMATFQDESVIAVNSKHANGVPKDCSKVTDAVAQKEQDYPAGGLSGTISLVAPGLGMNAAYNATALLDVQYDPNYQSTGTIAPNFATGDFYNASTPLGGYAGIWATDWPVSEDAVSAALMKATLINEFVLDSNVNGATDWVVTFPTKHHYVSATTARAPFKNKLTEKGSCQDTVLVTWSREEDGITPGGPDFSPAPTADGATICWEANVVTFNGKNIFASKNTLGVNTLFQSGWMEMAFQGSEVWDGNSLVSVPLVSSFSTNDAVLVDMFNYPPTASSVGTVTFAGLPVVGFAVEAFRPSLSSWYDGVFDHKWQSQDYGYFSFITNK